MSTKNITDEELDEIVKGIEDASIKSSIAYRALLRMKLPLTKGQISQLAIATGVSRYLIGKSLRVLEVFNEHPSIRAQWESEVIAARVNIAAVQHKIRRQGEQLKREGAGQPPPSPPDTSAP